MSGRDDWQRARYECKYYLRPEVATAIRTYLTPFVRPDPFARDKPGHRYGVWTLYLDSPDLVLFRMAAEGQRNRFKLRMRRYSLATDEQPFLEIKRRADTVVVKERARVPSEVAGREIARERADESLEFLPPTAVDPVAKRFAELTRTLRAVPMLWVRYLREAYNSRGHDSSRVTFDTELTAHLTRAARIQPPSTGWQRIHAEGTILEIKFTETMPGWVRTMIDLFELDRRSIPKYCLSVANVLDRSGTIEHSDIPAHVLATLRTGGSRWGI